MSSKYNKLNCCPKCSSRSVYLDCDENEWFNHYLICGYETPFKASDIGKGKGYSFLTNYPVLLKEVK